MLREETYNWEVASFNHTGYCMFLFHIIVLWSYAYFTSTSKHEKGHIKSSWIDRFKRQSGSFAFIFVLNNMKSIKIGRFISIQPKLLYNNLFSSRSGHVFPGINSETIRPSSCTTSCRQASTPSKPRASATPCRKIRRHLARNLCRVEPPKRLKVSPFFVAKNLLPKSKPSTMWRWTKVPQSPWGEFCCEWRQFWCRTRRGQRHRERRRESPLRKGVGSEFRGRSLGRLKTFWRLPTKQRFPNSRRELSLPSRLPRLIRPMQSWVDQVECPVWIDKYCNICKIGYFFVT